MEMNYILILVAAVAQFALGAVWHSPILFGNTWMKIMGADKYSKEEIAKMQKEMGPFYAVQFVLAIITVFVLDSNLQFNALSGAAAYFYAFVVWLGYIMPIQVAAVILGNTKRQFWAKQIGIMVSYQFVALMLSTFILTM